MRNAFAVRKAAQTPLKISISPASPASSSSSAEIEILTTPPHSRKRKQETDKDESQRKRQKKIKENKKNKLRYYDPQEESDVLTDSVLAVFENTTREHSPNRPFGDVSNTEETRSPSILAPLLSKRLDGSYIAPFNRLTAQPLCYPPSNHLPVSTYSFCLWKNAAN